MRARNVIVTLDCGCAWDARMGGEECISLRALYMPPVCAVMWDSDVDYDRHMEEMRKWLTALISSVKSAS